VAGETPTPTGDGGAGGRCTSIAGAQRMPPPPGSSTQTARGSLASPDTTRSQSPVRALQAVPFVHVATQPPAARCTTAAPTATLVFTIAEASVYGEEEPQPARSRRSAGIVPGGHSVRAAARADLAR